jgi:thiol reductant ABC exporter CydC subunit
MIERLRPLLRVARLDPTRRRLLIVSVALSAGALACGVALLATSGYLISRAAERPEVLSLLVAIVGVRAFGLARAGLRYAERLTSHDLALRQVAALRSDLFRRLVPLAPADLGARPGDLLSRFVADTNTLQDLHPRAIIPLAAAAVVGVGAALAAWSILPAAALVVVATLALGATLVPWVSARVAAQAARRQSSARAELTAELVETIDGAPDLVLAGRAHDRLRSLEQADRRLGAIARKDAVAASLAQGLGSALVGLGVVGTLIVGIDAVHGGGLAPVLLAAIVLLLLGAFEAVQPLPAAARRAQACMAAAERLEQVTAAEPSVRDPRTPANLGRQGDLALNGVSFAYDGATLMLRDVDLVLEPGCRIGLRGPSGSGKSTIAELLVRFRDPIGGSLTLDGVNLRDLSQDTIREAVTLVQQDAHLFNTSVRENLLLAGRGHAEATLWRALRTVELDGWVRDLPQGLDTLVGQEGAEVSGGQRQRLALARGLLAPGRFLVLDEPTAHLDRALAGRIMRRLAQAVGQRGLLVISHVPEDHIGLGTFSLAEGRLSGARETTDAVAWPVPMAAPSL